MSKLINIRGATGWLAGVLLLGGVFLIVASLGLIALNIYFSAVGLVEATGGDANLIESIWFPALVVIKGGPIGLIVGLVMGMMSSVVQSVFWLAPVEAAEDENDEDEEDEEVANRSHVPAPILTIFMALVMLYDVFSTWFYLSSSLPSDKNILMTLMRYIVTLVITLIAFSFGAEFWGALGVEVVRANYVEGVEALKQGWEESARMFDALRGVRTAPRVRVRNSRLE
ncbi:MAG: hypothetical protein AABZ78_19905 [Chloroflexota bacterium]